MASEAMQKGSVHMIIRVIKVDDFKYEVNFAIRQHSHSSRV